MAHDVDETALPPIPLPMSVLFEVTLNSTQWRKAFWMSQEERLWSGFAIIIFACVILGNVLKLLDIPNDIIITALLMTVFLVVVQVWLQLAKAYQRLQNFWTGQGDDGEARRQLTKALGGDVAPTLPHPTFKEFFFDGASGDDDRRYVAQWQFKEEGLMCRPQGSGATAREVIPWTQFKYFRLEKTDIYILCDKSNRAYFLPVNQAPQGTLEYLEALCRHYLIRYVETTRVKGSTRNFYRN